MCPSWIRFEVFRGQGIYPYSLASAGAITGENMEVYGIESLEAAADGVISDDEKQPGHIVSNALAGQGDPNAIVLGSGTSISGDVKARGSIDVGGATVQGKVLPNAAQQNLPDVTVEAFDPAGKTGVYTWTGAAGPDGGPPQLVGRARYSGDLTIDDLDMAEGLLYVDGDVTVTGTVKGKGAIVATGKITVTGSMETEADHAALVAKDDITIHGDGPNSSRFQGLVYSEGSIDIARTTIMGAAVSKDTAGTTKLEDVVAVAVPELTRMDLEIHATLEKAKESAGQAMKTSIGGGEPDPIGIRAPDGSFTELAPNPDTAGLKELGAQLGDLPSEPRAWDLVVEEKSGVLNPNPSGAIGGIDFNDAFGEFLSYVDEHRNHNVQIIDVFQLDLNTLISLEVELEMMYHTTVMTK